MRVVHIAYLYGLNNTGGACMAATRLHLALLKHGIDSHFICLQQKEAGPNVYELPARGPLRVIQYVITRVVWLLGYLTPEHRIIMPNLVPLLTLRKTLRKIKPDVVHIHWYMMDTISFSQLADMPCPVVMTLHDLFDVNIKEPYPASDRRYIDGITTRNTSYYERWLFGRKQKVMAQCKPIMIGPSQWICDTSASSIIGRQLQYFVVGNAFDAIFSYEENRCNPHTGFHILFGANGGRQNPKKGWQDFVKVIPFLSSDIKSNSTVQIFGESGNPYSVSGLSIEFLGPIADHDQLKQAYHDADILILPSVEDNAPNVKFEAWLCGLPVIAFMRTGCAEYVVSEINGWVAKDKDWESFAKGIEHYYKLFKECNYTDIRKNIAHQSAHKFSNSSVTSKVLTVYQSASNEKTN